ncbi:MAG: hypothetical protein ACRDT0_22935 [Pseudonocardiaceae bacterium]
MRHEVLIDPTEDPRLDASSTAVDGPEWKAVARAYIRRGVRRIGDPRAHRALELIASDHTQAEIAVELGMTEKAARAAAATGRIRGRPSVYRWRRHLPASTETGDGIGCVTRVLR